MGREAEARDIIYGVIREADQHGSTVESLRPRVTLAQFWLDGGEIELARSWAEEYDMQADAWPRSFGHIAPALVLGHLLQQEGDARGAIRILDTLIEEGERREQPAPLVRAYALKALAHRTEGDAEASQQASQQAMQLGAKGRFFRSYLVSTFDTRTLLTSTPAHLSQPGAGMATLQPIPQGVVTEREREVIALVAMGLSNTEIADRLFISTFTVKNHLSRVYEKLTVKNRRAAVDVARSMGLIQ